MNPTEWKVYWALSEYARREKPVEVEIHHQDPKHGTAYLFPAMIGVHIVPLIVQGYVEEVEKV